jgi:hypothetical protein
MATVVSGAIFLARELAEKNQRREKGRRRRQNGD